MSEFARSTDPLAFMLPPGCLPAWVSQGVGGPALAGTGLPAWVPAPVPTPGWMGVPGSTGR